MLKKSKYFAMALALILAASIPYQPIKAASCPDLKIIFARGSGGERHTNQDYLEFKSTIETRLKTTSLSYEFVDLDYPAVSVGVDKLETTIGAYVSAGEAYKFGDSVNLGVKNLTKLVNHECPSTKYVLGGYSQGAIVVSKALKNLNHQKIIYAATFGDPKIYLPEGEGLIPPACKNQNLSDYRAYVPNCRVFKGMLGGHVPYRPESLIGKVGTWCNKQDIFCSKNINGISNHLSYTKDGLYEDAAKVIFDKTAKNFNFKNTLTSPHDTAILIDSTGSMDSLIDKFKSEALRLAKQTLDSGGRVALYDYRDLDDPYEPVEHCNFHTCTLEIFESELEKITTDSGGDTKESLLSSSFKVMNSLNWKYGATKSLVVLTDAGFHSPDRDSITFKQVTDLSKKIDPVNFYIVTTKETVPEYQALATETDGKVVSDLGELNLLTDYIMERYDSLPRVEEDEAIYEDPQIEVLNTEQISTSEVKITFKNTGNRAVITLNDVILGITSENSIFVTGLDQTRANQIILSPLSSTTRGESVEINLPAIIPKAPNTGAN